MSQQNSEDNTKQEQDGLESESNVSGQEGEKKAKQVTDTAHTENDQVENTKMKSEQATAKQQQKLQTKTESTKNAVETSEPQRAATKSNINENKEQQRQTQTSETVIVKKSFSWLALCAFILSVSAACAAGYLWWQYQLWFTTQQQVQNLQQQSATQTEQNIQQLQARINELQQKQASQNTQANKVAENVNSLTGRVKELGQAQPNYWLAAEALYLVNLAERRLLIEQDIATAIELLVSANVRLTAMKDPSVLPIQQAISEDVAKLHAVVQPEFDAIYLSLSGLISQIEHLPFANMYLPEQISKVTTEKAITAEMNDWQSNLKTSLYRFFDYFVDIRRNDTNVGPSLPADQQWFVRANLTTQMLMAQSAVLEQNDKIYQDALAQSKNWLLQYFDLDKAELAAAVLTIEELQNKEIELTLPASLTSQALLSNFVQAQLILRTGGLYDVHQVRLQGAEYD